MRHAHKALRKRGILRSYSSLVIGFLSIFIAAGLSSAGHNPKHNPKHFPKKVTCGAMITTDTKLTSDLNCDTYTDGPALTVDGGTLDLNGHRVIGNPDINCIEVTGGATLRNGTVMNCKEGILVEGDRNKIIGLKSLNNERRGFRITDGDENLLYKCLAKGNGRKGFSIEEGDDNVVEKCSAMDNGQQGFSLEKGDSNKIYYSKANANCRDGIEIDEGSDNRVVNNFVEDNGKKEVCDKFAKDPTNPDDDYYYKPWYYAGIDVTNNSNNNEIKYNRACGNLGCVPCYDEVEGPTCKARERNFWDENVDDFGDSVSTNVWENNRVVCQDVMPEFSPEPED